MSEEEAEGKVIQIAGESTPLKQDQKDAEQIRVDIWPQALSYFCVVSISATKVKEEQDLYWGAMKDRLPKAYTKGFRPGQKGFRKAMVKRAGGEPQFYEPVFRKLFTAGLEGHERGKEVLYVDRIQVALPQSGGDAYTIRTFINYVPDVELLLEKGTEVTVPKMEFTQEMVDSRLEALRQRHRIVEGREGPLQEGDMAVVTARSTIDGAQYFKGCCKKEKWELAAVSGGVHPEELRLAVIGMSAGEEKEVDFVLTSGFEDDAGADVHAVLKVHSTYKYTLPEIDEEFAKKLELGSKQELIEREEQRAKSVFETQKRNMQLNNASNTLMTFCRMGPIPDGWIHRQLEDRWNMYLQQYKSVEELEKAHGFSEQEIKDGLTSQACSELTRVVCLYRFALAQGIEFEEEESFSSGFSTFTTKAENCLLAYVSFVEKDKSEIVGSEEVKTDEEAVD